MSRIFIKMCRGWDLHFFLHRKNESSGPSNSTHRLTYARDIRTRFRQASDMRHSFRVSKVRRGQEQQSYTTINRWRKKKRRSTYPNRHIACACAFFAWMPAYPNPNTQLIVRCSTPFSFLSDAHLCPTESLWHAQISTHLHKHRQHWYAWNGWRREIQRQVQSTLHTMSLYILIPFDDGNKNQVRKQRQKLTLQDCSGATILIIFLAYANKKAKSEFIKYEILFMDWIFRIERIGIMNPKNNNCCTSQIVRYANSSIYINNNDDIFPLKTAIRKRSAGMSQCGVSDALIKCLSPGANHSAQNRFNGFWMWYGHFSFSIYPNVNRASLQPTSEKLLSDEYQSTGWRRQHICCLAEEKSSKKNLEKKNTYKSFEWRWFPLCRSHFHNSQESANNNHMFAHGLGFTPFTLLRHFCGVWMTAQKWNKRNRGLVVLTAMKLLLVISLSRTLSSAQQYGRWWLKFPEDAASFKHTQRETSDDKLKYDNCKDYILKHLFF